MTDPRYSGIDRQNRPYVLTASSATQASGKDDIVSLAGPKADMTTNSGNWVEITAYTGTYQPQPQLLDLYGDVELYQDRGNEFHTDSARIDIADGTATSDQPVTGQGPFGHVTAEGFTHARSRRGDPIHRKDQADAVAAPQGRGMNRGAAALLAAFVLLTAAAGARAQLQSNALGLAGDNNNKPLNIEAENGIEWQQNNKVYIARGNAKATRGDDSVTADTLYAYYRDAKAQANGAAPRLRGDASAGQQSPFDNGSTQVYRIEAEGHVVFATPSQTAYGDRADYDVDQATLVVTGKNLRIVTPAGRHHRARQLRMVRSEADRRGARRCDRDAPGPGA